MKSGDLFKVRNHLRDDELFMCVSLEGNPKNLHYLFLPTGRLYWLRFSCDENFTSWLNHFEVVQ